MMDSSNHSPADELEVVHQNGVHEEPSNSGENGVASTDSPNESGETVAPNGDFKNSNQLDTIATDDSSLVENKGSDNNVDGNNVIVSKKEEQSRARNDPVKNKNAKAPSCRGVPESSMKKSKDGKVKEASSAISNGTLARRVPPIKSRSFNDQRLNQLSKHLSKSEAASSEVPVPTEKTKSKSLKKGTPDKVQDDAESSATNSEDAKPNRVGTLPTYGFSFRCDERAARRKEFYTKLEEKIHAKELEKSNMQAKTMESLEAEIKILRKSLTFKATPMPSFYQEPPPPKIELKKMPTTRPKSPKLGRKKSSTNSESDGNTSSSSRQGRFSLDEKVSHSKPTKGNNPVHQTKPQRKSLPSQLASQKVGSSNSTTAPTSSKAKKNNESNISSATKKEEKTKMAAVNEENNGTLSSEKSEALNGASSDKLDEAETHVNEDITAEENPQLSLVQEPFPAELQA